MTDDAQRQEPTMGEAGNDTRPDAEQVLTPDGMNPTTATDRERVDGNGLREVGPSNDVVPEAAVLGDDVQEKNGQVIQEGIARDTQDKELKKLKTK